MIQHALQRFEPRFDPDSIEVQKVDIKRDYRFIAKVRIKAVLHVEPFIEPVVFDTKVEFDRGTIEVESVEEAR